MHLLTTGQRPVHHFYFSSVINFPKFPLLPMNKAVAVAISLVTSFAMDGTGTQHVKMELYPFGFLLNNKI